MSRDKRRRRRLSQQDLRGLGVQGGLLVARYAPDGRMATLEQLTAESATGRTFARRLTKPDEISEASEGG